MLFSKTKLRLIPDMRDIMRNLPTTQEELETFFSDIILLFSLPETDDTKEIICSLIMHMPQHTCKAPYRFFGESVLKAMANKCVFTHLKAFDEARRAANAAQEALDKQAKEKEAGNVININQAETQPAKPPEPAV